MCFDTARKHGSKEKEREDKENESKRARAHHGGHEKSANSGEVGRLSTLGGRAITKLL